MKGNKAVPLFVEAKKGVKLGAFDASQAVTTILFASTMGIAVLRLVIQSIRTHFSGQDFLSVWSSWAWGWFR